MTTTTIHTLYIFTMALAIIAAVLLLIDNFRLKRFNARAVAGKRDAEERAAFWFEQKQEASRASMSRYRHTPKKKALGEDEWPSQIG